MNIDNKVHSTPELDKKRHWLRMFLKILLIMIVVIIIAAIIALIRGQFIDVRHYTIHTRSSGKVRIVAITDLHGCMLGHDQERVVSRIQEADPDMIVYLGDMIEQTRAEESVEPLVVLTRRLSQIAPIYYVDGNHEEAICSKEPETYKKLSLTLADIGAVQLKNETVHIMVGDTTVNLCGITSHYYWENGEDEIAAKLRECDGINVMLCHYPETVIWRKVFEGGGLDLALCGHTHGGLVQVPFKGGLYAPESGWWPTYVLGEYRIYSDTGWHHYGGGQDSDFWGTMIISGGLAGEHHVPRINNPMEISVVDFE